MRNQSNFYINGQWVSPITAKPFAVINPATEEICGEISLGSAADVDRAVAAAKAAFPIYSTWSRQERLALLQRIIEGMQARHEALARAVMIEMGSPLWFAKAVQVDTSIAHFQEQIRVLRDYAFESWMGDTLILREPIGVCGFHR